MLEYLRNAADKPVAKILIGILAFSFVGWGVAEWIFGGAASDITLVRVGNHEITINDFNMEKSREMANMTVSVMITTSLIRVMMKSLPTALQKIGSLKTPA